MHKAIIYSVTFLAGGCVMVLELVGSRIIAPYVGTSIFAWSSLISVILGSLSIGYWLGGHIADKSASYKTLSVLFLASSISVAVIAAFKDYILILVSQISPDIKIVSFLSCVVLFSVSTIFLGMITPYLAKLMLETIKNSGKTVGKLYAVSTAGSILGTLLTGFFFISYFKNTEILFGISVVLLTCSALVFKKNLSLKMLFITIIFVLFMLPIRLQADEITMDTLYHKVSIRDSIDATTHKPIRNLVLGSEVHSGMFLDTDELVYSYTGYYDLISFIKPAKLNVAMLGAGAFSYPKHFLTKFPDSKIDVIEIDPKLTEIAEKYFRLKENPRMNIINEDARTFIDKNKEKYDAILVDAFLSYYSVPFHLTTKETVKSLHDSLNNDGIIIVNVISSLEGKKSKFLYSEYKTYKEVFSRVEVLPVEGSSNKEKVQNIIIVAFKSKKNFALKDVYELKQKTLTETKVLTDEFAPVDQYIMDFLN